MFRDQRPFVDTYTILGFDSNPQYPSLSSRHEAKNKVVKSLS